jgi:hypothetical protein
MKYVQDYYTCEPGGTTLNTDDGWFKRLWRKVFS